MSIMKRADGADPNGTPIERLRYKSSSTWEDVCKWNCETSNTTGAFLEVRIAGDDFYLKDSQPVSPW